MRAGLWQWIARAAVAASLFAALETALALSRSPWLRGDLFGIANLFVCLFALFGFWASWMAMVFSLADLGGAEKSRLTAPMIFSAMAGVAVAAYALAVAGSEIEELGFDQPEIVRELTVWSYVVILVLALSFAGAIAHPIFRFLARIISLFDSLRAARVVACLFAMTIAVRAASSGFEPLYLSPLAGCAGAFALSALLLAVRQLSPSARVSQVKTSTRVAVLILLFSFAVAPLASCHQPAAAFALHDSAFVGAPLVRLLEVSADLDGDGTFSTLFGGADCDEGDPARGGGLRDVPGDGVDQDCRGGDAPKLEKTALDVLPFPGCTIPEGPLSAVLITIDSLRSDRFKPSRMPNLWGYAERSIFFRRAYTPATTDALAFASIINGTAVSKLGAKNPNVEVTFEQRSHIAVELHRAGFNEAAYSALGAPGSGVIGFSGNFTWMRDAVRQPLGNKGVFNSAMVSANAMRFLSVTREPFFLWMHYADTQAPHYDPHFSARRFRNASGYDLEVAYTDVHVDDVLRFISRSPFADRTVVFIAGDHGEELGERGRVGHGRDVFESSTRVPLLMRVPGCPGRIENRAVSLTQIAPTIGLLGGVEHRGVPLFFAASATVAPPLLVTEAIDGYFNRAIVDGRYKLIEDVQSAGRLLFDLEKDPDEQDNIYERSPDVVKKIDEDFQRWLDEPRNRVLPRFARLKE